MTIQEQINQSHQDRQEKPRPHLGCSMLGHACDRWLWLSFRWSVIEKFDGRILRLFRRGQLEEQTVIQDLRAIGIDVSNTSTNQSRVSFGSHASGSIDGILNNAILEIKTHALKSFDDLVKNGVKKSKPMHWAQMQVYMMGSKLNKALYYAVCKNDDRIYTEEIELDKNKAQALIERGKYIALSDTIPAPLSQDASWYECKFCPAHSFCFKTKITKEVNCRTCAHSTALADSTWKCERHNAENIPYDFQLKGCDDHVLHPELVPYKRLPSTSEHEAIYEIDGVPIRNGSPDAFVYSSKEILANPLACAHPDNTIELLRDSFGARITPC